MSPRLGVVDWTIIAAYLLAVVGLGVAAGFLRRRGERGGEGGHYFLAGNTLSWPVIGLAMFAANIATVHLVSLAEAACKYGLVFGNFEWMAGFTLPDFLERRFNRACRDVLSVVSLLSARVQTVLLLGYPVLGIWYWCCDQTIVQRGAFGGGAPQSAADTYTFLIVHLLPVGLKGLVVAAMLAAAMQTCSAALNSTATSCSSRFSSSSRVWRSWS